MLLDRYVLRDVPVTEWKKWDLFIDNHPDGHLLQSWGWGELKASIGWYPFRFSLWDERIGQMVAAAQVLCRTIPKFPLWAGHLAYIPKGPVIDWSDPGLCQAFFTQLNTQMRKHGALALRLEPNRLVNAVTSVTSVTNVTNITNVTSSTVNKPLSLYPVSPVQPVRSIVLNLLPTEDALLAGMKEKWRYNLRLAQRKGVAIREAQTVEDIQAWYALLQTTGNRDHFGIHTIDYYLKAWHIFAPRQQARLFLAEYEGHLLAGIFVALLAKQAIYLYGASSNEHRNLMPNYLLQWEAIRWAKQQGAVQYDFWGIPETDREDEAMAGVHRFKRGWGGERVRFVGCYEHTYRPLTMRVARKMLPAWLE
jgi:peptidoglycan pentaglycine glycine transferase (the first glycine)